MTCSACGSENPDTSHFCGKCGSALAVTCPSCGATVAAGNAFCGQCGTAVGEAVAPSVAPPAASGTGTPVGPETERRLVSVLFVDLVGFTTLSEARDPEAVRELLSAYFDQARTIVGRYGGAIEKFIGDAVMAVWGTPISREDDAERAVRAGLELVDAVAVIGEESGLDGLQARAGVVTGEAAVNLGAIGQGMVAGDVVNTAARVQSAAEPGSVLVDEVTCDASSRAIGYSSAGEHELKGKAEPIRLFTAGQILAGGGGAQRFDGLEAPFLGRDRELRLVKELFHDSAEQNRARLVLVSGMAGVGKSRLGWEFFKYLDGLSLETLWHVGRCLSYGEGVAYWALAETVRMRLRALEGDSDDVVVDKLKAALERYIADDEERSWLLPRLAVLLGVADRIEVRPGELERESLFAGWRLFIERLSEDSPVVLVLEDFQYADAGLLDFVDHLLDWSAEKPIFVLGLTRPELSHRRPEWGTHRRNVTELHLEPVSDEVVGRMVDELVHGLPESIRSALATRAEGIPLFAIETVRMLIDRDLVIPQGGVYVLAEPAADLGELDLPPTLHALVAARLDNLPEQERRLVKDASVLGLSFTPAAVASIVSAVGSLPTDAVDELLSSLARKQILSIQPDARSPEAGQYRFVQKVMRGVAYETLSRRDRKALHLAAASWYEASGEAEDLAGVIASHYLDAAEAVPEDVDAPELQTAAVGHLERAGDRARSLAAPEEAQRYYERALVLTGSEPDRARLAEQAGAVAALALDYERAIEHFTTARSLLEAAGDVRGAARVASHEGDVLAFGDRNREAIELLQAAYHGLSGEGHDLDVARIANTLATAHMGMADRDAADQWLEIAIETAEAAGAWDILARALNIKGLRLLQIGRPIEGQALVTGALALAREHGLTRRAVIETSNLANLVSRHDLGHARAFADESIELSRRIGDRSMELFSLAVAAQVDFHRGEWSGIRAEDFLARITGLGPGLEQIDLSLPAAAVAAWSGSRGPELVLDLGEEKEDVLRLGAQLTVRALLAQAHGEHEAGLVAASRAVEIGRGVALQTEELLFAWPTAIDCALSLGRVEEAVGLIEGVASSPPGLLQPLLQGQLDWLQGRVAVLGGQADPGTLFTAAERVLRDLGARPWLARALLDHAEWLAAEGDQQAAALAGEALAIFEHLGADPFTARAQQLVPADQSDQLVSLTD